jgi:senataxin
MREEDEIMEELHGLDGYFSLSPDLNRTLLPTMYTEDSNDALYRELKSFPTGAHWFCPRRHKEDHIDYDNPDEPEEDMSLETKHQLIEDAKRRHKVAYRYSLILGLAPEVSGTLSKDYIDQLDEQLTTCDKCVHNWHMGRKPYLKELAE